MTAMLTADWCPLGKDTYYRKFEIYSMAWQNEINFDHIIVAPSMFGGPIAVVRDRKKFVKVQGSSKPIISIYSSSGRHISSIIWNSGPLITLGWSTKEDLLCVQDDGSVLIYDMYGNYQHTFSMGKDAKDTKIIDAKLFVQSSSTGIAIMTKAHRVFLVNNVSEPKVRSLPDIPGGYTNLTWAVRVDNRDTKVIVAKDNELFVLSDSESQAKPIEPKTKGDWSSSIVDIAVSLNNRHVALLRKSGLLWMGSADFRTCYGEVQIGFHGKPEQLVWCGTQAVLCYWRDDVLLVGVCGETVQFGYGCRLHLVTEIDGVRVLTQYTHEMIQKVPMVVQQIFRINSTDPGSFLLEASKQFQKRSHRADEYIRLVKDKLSDAVMNCIQAAGYEFDTETQKKLIQAAKFGKSFIPGTHVEPYVDMIRNLRVLNAIRNDRIGIPLTYTQFQHLTIRVLLDRLVLRKHYYLAICIAKYLKLPEEEGSSRILVHWACYKVKQTQLDHEQVAREIANKLGYAPGVSYSKIALKAADCGRTQLAIKLMDYEPQAKQQVPLLLKLGEVKPALVKAIESADTDLIYMVLLHMREHMPLAEFQLEIRKYPSAQALYIKYCRDHNREALRDIFIQEDDFNSQAALCIQDSYSGTKSSARDISVASLEAAHECYKKARNDFMASICEEQIRLLRHQRTLEDKFHAEFVGLSLLDTVQKLLMMQELKLADKMRVEYKVNDRSYWWLRILTLSELGNWGELDKFAKSKKSPIGYEPFVDVCLSQQNQHEAKKYLPKVKDENKVKYYVKANMPEAAAQVAFEQKDVHGLQYIESKCGSSNQELSDKISLMIVQLGNKK